MTLVNLPTGRDREENGKPCVTSVLEITFRQNSLSFKHIFLFVKDQKTLMLMLTFVTHKRFAVLFFLPSCCVNSLLIANDERHRNYAPINVMPAGGGGRAWVEDLTFSKNFQSNSLPTGKLFQSNATKFPHPRLHIAVNPKAEPKKGTIKISPNKTLQSFINVAASPKIHVPVTAVIIRFNHNPCYTA